MSMVSKIAGVMVVLGIVALAQADNINPAAWSVSPYPTLPADQVTWSINSGVLTANTYNSYTWTGTPSDGYWDTDQDYSVCQATQTVMAPAGTTGMNFRAMAQFIGATIVGNSLGGPVVTVSVFYSRNTPSPEPAPRAFITTNSSDLQYMALADLDPSAPVTIRLLVTSEVSEDQPYNLNEKLDAQVTGQFSDFAFVVPEPATMAILAAGLVATSIRRRK